MVRTEVDNLREEVKGGEEQSTLEQEYAQAKLELAIERTVQQGRRKWQEIELAEAKKQLSESKDSVESVNGNTDSIVYQ